MYSRHLAYLAKIVLCSKFIKLQYSSIQVRYTEKQIELEGDKQEPRRLQTGPQKNYKSRKCRKCCKILLIPERTECLLIGTVPTACYRHARPTGFSLGMWFYFHILKHKYLNKNNTPG